MQYSVVLKNYSGPMDLLLDLIKKDEIDIYDIPINQITDGFLEYISLAKSLNLELASEFLIMASTLIEIKSKMLLPKPKLENDEGEIDPRAELVEKLIEYQKYKEMAKLFEELEKKEADAFYKLREEDIMPDDFDLLKEAQAEDLKRAFLNIIKRVESSKPGIILRERISTKDAMKSIRRSLREKEILNFSSLIRSDFSKIEIITFFLALLELIKINYIVAVQTNNWEDIEIRMGI